MRDVWAPLREVPFVEIGAPEGGPKMSKESNLDWNEIQRNVSFAFLLFFVNLGKDLKRISMLGFGTSCTQRAPAHLRQT